MTAMRKTEKAILSVSFGTSFAKSRDAAIGGIERALQRAFPDREVRRAFTSGFIIRKIFRETGEQIDTVSEALQRAAADGIRELLVQPTHFMKGIEYDEMKETLEQFRDRFDRLLLAEPLLASNDDFRLTAEAVAQSTEQAIRDLQNPGSPADRIDDTAKDDRQDPGSRTERTGDAEKTLPETTAVILMGHGTSKQEANTVYETMQQAFTEAGYPYIYIATVEAEPTIETVMKKLEGKGYQRILLRPLMVVAGDHACNDMAGEEETAWKTILTRAGYEVIPILRGLGEEPSIQRIYVQHARNAAR